MLDGGVVFTWKIDVGASTAPNFTKVGTASNSKGRQFTIYKDSGRELFVVNQTTSQQLAGWRASSAFWCF